MVHNSSCFTEPKVRQCVNMSHIPCINYIYKTYEQLTVGRDSSVSLVTRYRLDSPGTESHWGAIFSLPVQTCPEAHPASYTMGTGTGSFTAVKRPGRHVEHPPPSSTKVKQRVELYLFFPSGPSCPVLGSAEL
jgi:hypothetical protein